MPKGPPEEVQIATLLARVGGAQATAFAALLSPSACGRSSSG